jgi:predicted TIM-barrel fold metal-dependent hydrolase
MDDAGVDKAVILDVALKPDQVEGINTWIMGIKDQRLIPFGAMHPDYKDYKKEIKRLKDHGIKGIKFQSTWQNCLVDDDRMLRIYEEIGEDMVVFLHAGGSRTKKTVNIEAPPHRIARVLEKFPKIKIIAAHFGGNYMIEESKKHLIGRNVYLDTSAPPTIGARMDQKTVLELIEAHGVKKIIFGSDFPIGNKKEDVAYLKKLPLSEEAKERILWKNASELLQLM